MKMIHCSDYEELSKLCANSIISELKENPSQLLCAATGNSPKGVYINLDNEYNKSPEIFSKLSIIKLDEWGGIPSTDENSCESFIQEQILKPLQISKDRYISFDTDPKDPEQECMKIQKELHKKGPIDICILGLGKNGHIGFNEPTDELTPDCHIAQLSKESLQHQMTTAMKHKPAYGLTLGMADILQSHKIMILLTGANKKSIIAKFLSKKITPQLPASFLWLHHNVECYIDVKAT